jgi:hypothetical protein
MMADYEVTIYAQVEYTKTIQASDIDKAYTEAHLDFAYNIGDKMSAQIEGTDVFPT